jgi:hypothetical protein
MSIFKLHSNVVGDHRDFVRSFFTVADDRAREFIDHELVELDASFGCGEARSARGGGFRWQNWC